MAGKAAQTGKQSTCAPGWFTGVIGTARCKGSAGNRGRPVLVEGRAFNTEYVNNNVTKYVTYTFSYVSDLFRGVIAMSGSYDVRSYLQGHYDDNVYFNNPVDYLSNLNDDYYLPLLQKADKILILSGQGNYEAPERSRALSDILNAKGIPHTLDLWGQDVDHDWPWWRKMLPYALGKML